MGELRKDYFLDRWVIIASERGKRPHEFVQEQVKQKAGKCYFCPGSEDETPPEIFRIGAKNRWKMRVFPNKFAAVRQEGQASIKTDNIFYTFSANYGMHEVIVETNDHKKQLWDLAPKDIVDLISLYSMRIKELGKMNGIKYVQVFKNSGKEGGTSILHSHSQVIAYNKVPELVEQEAKAIKEFKEKMNICPYCCIINSEKDSFRRCFENRNFVAFAPYASRFPFEIWVLAKQHVKSITDLDNGQVKDLAEVMNSILKKLKKLNAPYNFMLHNSPAGEDFHFHIEMLPRLATWAGFEFNGTIINTLPPEEAAKFYRGE